MGLGPRWGSTDGMSPNLAHEGGAGFPAALACLPAWQPERASFQSAPPGAAQSRPSGPYFRDA